MSSWLRYCCLQDSLTNARLDEIECKATLPKIICMRRAKHMSLFTCLQLTFCKDFGEPFSNLLQPTAKNKSSSRVAKSKWVKRLVRVAFKIAA